MCYKRSMKKWMSERLKRRKKSGGSKDQAAAPEPLQPKYFEDEDHVPQKSAADAAEPVRAPEPPEPQPQPAVEPAASPSAGQGLRPTRRRRRRGGRGRASRAQVAPSPAAPISTADQVAPAPTPQTEPLAAEPVASELQPPAPAPERRSKGIVVLAIGLPGSGKTTWFKRHEIRPLSSDMMRTLLFDDVREQRFQDLVFSNLRSMLKARLIARRPTNYVDATNLTPQERQHWIKLAKDFGYDVHALFFDVPLEVCIERHQRRDRVVPEDVMRRMAAKLKPPTFEEGFAKITVVRVKKKEDSATE